MPQSTIHKTRGIVLKHLKYSETSIIAKIYTESYGIQSYLIKGARKKGSRMRSGLFQNLSLVDMVVYHKTKSNIQHIKEIKIASPFISIPFDIKKSTISIFVNEILYKCLKEEESNPALFNFIFDAIKFLDRKRDNITDFHLLFMIQLTVYLGFSPKHNYSAKNKIFNMSEGVFQERIPEHIYFIGDPLTRYFSEYLHIGFEDIDHHKITSSIRKALLESLLDYYKLHLEGFGSLKSYQILQTVLNPV